MLAHERTNGNQPSDCPRIEKLFDASQPCMVAETEADHHLPSRARNVFLQLCDTIQGIGERLLAEDMATGLERLHAHRNV